MPDETTGRLAHIRERAAAATPGDWHAEDSDDAWSLHAGPRQILKAPKHSTPFAEYWPGTGDAAFIAAARSDVPWLLALVDRLQRELAAVNRCDDTPGSLLAGQAPPAPCTKPRGHDGAHRNADGAAWQSLTGISVDFPEQFTDEQIARWKAAWEAQGGGLVEIHRTGQLIGSAGKVPECVRCFDRGYVPDWSRGLDSEFGEPGKKPCPDCQAVARDEAPRTLQSESIEP